MKSITPKMVFEKIKWEYYLQDMAELEI
jgi:hypothetical protein